MLWKLLWAMLQRRASAQPLIDRSLALRRDGRLRDAELVLREAAAQFPRDPLVATNLAVVLLEQDQPREGVEWLQRALESDPRCAPAHYNLANVMRASGRREEAVQHYQAAVDRLLAQGDAYRCYQTAEELEVARAEARQTDDPALPTRLHRDLTAEQIASFEAEGRPAVIRFRTPLEGETVIDDLVRGQVVFEHRLLGDTVLMRGGGRPTYQLANPLDDLAMGITHVIRGEDLLSSTPRQRLLVEALGGTFPQTAHLSMILGADKKRLSKRHGAASVEEFREAGYLPEALVNFLALCGWSWDGETELMSVAELVERFSLERVNPAPAVFDHEKLAWMNGQYLRALDTAAYAAALRSYLEDAGSPLAAAARLDELVPVVQEKLGAFGEFDALVGSLLESREPDPESWQKLLNDEHAARIIDAAITSLSALSAWTVENVESALRAVCEELEMKPRQAFLPIRIAIAGSTVAAGLYESIAFLGSEASLARLQHARAALTNV